MVHHQVLRLVGRQLPVVSVVPQPAQVLKGLAVLPLVAMRLVELVALVVWPLVALRFARNHVRVLVIVPFAGRLVAQGPLTEQQVRKLHRPFR